MPGHLVGKKGCHEVGSARSLQLARPGTRMRLRGYRYRQRHDMPRRRWQLKSKHRVRVRATVLPAEDPIPQRRPGEWMPGSSIRTPLGRYGGVFPMRSVSFDLHSAQTTRVCRAVEPRFR